MSGKTQRTNTPLPAPSVGGRDMFTTQEREVRTLLAQGKTKGAVEIAKQVHKGYSTPASEALLTDAYAARIRSLLDIGLAKEAKALLELVRERYPSAWKKLTEIGVAVAGNQSNLDELLAPLNDPALSPEMRHAIEATILRQVPDLSALAQCAALPPEHLLRTGAAALVRGFEAVTTGVVTGDALLLPEVPRHGVLAPWKFLVRAIGCFYRDDATGCDHCLQAIPSGSVPSRLIPALQALIGRKPADGLQGAAATLLAQVGGKWDSLRSALESLDTALAAEEQHKIIPAIQRAVSLCCEVSPRLVDRLRQHAFVYAMRLNLPETRVRAALGGPAIKDAYFWRLWARALETSEEPLEPIACRLWEEFRRHAVAEGWFRNDGPEVAALYLHMAELLQGVPGEARGALRSTFADFADLSPYYDDQSPAIRAAAAQGGAHDQYCLNLDTLFERACKFDPHREAFEQWLDWARQDADWKAADRVCTIWSEALPKDSRPLLLLMESAEKRGALNKAFGFLGLAQERDPLSTEVRRAAFRLLVATALRHACQRKPHLAERDVTRLEELPQAKEGRRPAFLACLRWICGVIRGDSEAAARFFSQMSGLLESPAAAILISENIARVCGLSDDERKQILPLISQVGRTDARPSMLEWVVRQFLPERTSADKPGPLTPDIARACALGDDVGVACSIPPEWESQILQELKKPPAQLAARELLALGEAALRRNRRELAYSASGAGLAQGGDMEGRFLFLRAKALPGSEFQRRSDCLAAAAELGRRRRDMDLVNEAVEIQRGPRRHRPNFLSWADPVSEPTSALSSAELNRVLEREKKSSKFPTSKWFPAVEPLYGDESSMEEEDEEDFEEFERDFEEFSRLLDEMERSKAKRDPGRRPGPDPSKQGELF